MRGGRLWPRSDGEAGLDEFQEDHLGRVAPSRAELDDPGVAAGSLRIARRDLLEELVDRELVVVELGESLAIFTTADRVDELRGEGAIAATNGVSGGEAATVPGADGLDEILIEELELGVRSYNCLKRAGIQTVGELVRKSESELNAIPNFGRKSIEEVQETLRARGLSLRQD